MIIKTRSYRFHISPCLLAIERHSYRAANGMRYTIRPYLTRVFHVHWNGQQCSLCLSVMRCTRPELVGYQKVTWSHHHA